MRMARQLPVNYGHLQHRTRCSPRLMLGWKELAATSRRGRDGFAPEKCCLLSSVRTQIVLLNDLAPRLEAEPFGSRASLYGSLRTASRQFGFFPHLQRSRFMVEFKGEKLAHRPRHKQTGKFRRQVHFGG